MSEQAAREAYGLWLAKHDIPCPEDRGVQAKNGNEFSVEEAELKP